MIKIIAIAAASLLLISCAKSPDEVKLPSSPADTQALQKYIDDDLKGEEQALAKQFIAENAMAIAVGNGKDMTVADAISMQRESNEKKKAEQDRIDALKAQMNNAIEVVYINHKSFQKLSYTGYDFRIKLRNRQDKPIFGVKGNLVFKDAFGKEAGRVGIEHMGLLNKDDNVYIQHQTMDFENTFKDGNYTDVTFEPEVIVYSDKSSINLYDK